MDIITTYQHLKGVEIDETNVEPELMIHVILRASEYAKIKPNLAKARLAKKGLTMQHTKKVVSDSPGLVDFAIRLVNSVLNLPDGQVK